MPPSKGRRALLHGGICLEGFLEEKICSWWKGRAGNPAVKRVGKSRWDGVSVVPCHWRQEFSSCQVGRGEVLERQSTETRLAAWPGSRTERTHRA